MHRRPKLLTEAYCHCLQHWAEKVSLPVSQEILTFSRECKRAVLGHRQICDHHQTRYNGGTRDGETDTQPSTTPYDYIWPGVGFPNQRARENTYHHGIPQQNRMPMLQGRPSLYTSSQLSNHSLGTPSLPAVPLTRVLVVRLSATPTQSFINTAVRWRRQNPHNWIEKPPLM